MEILTTTCSSFLKIHYLDQTVRVGIFLFGRRNKSTINAATAWKFTVVILSLEWCKSLTVAFVCELRQRK